MNCIEIIIKHIADNNFDGLHNGNECGCELNNIAPCSESIMWCTPGYKVIPPSDVDCEYDFYICDNKDDQPWENE